MARKVVTGLSTLAVSAVLLAPGAVSVPVAAGSSAPPTAAASGGPDCSKPVYLGVAGSGQLDKKRNARKTRYMGEPIASLSKTIARLADQPLSRKGIHYDAASAKVLAKGRIDIFAESIYNGYDKTMAALKKIRRQCGNDRSIILAGYSQGAMVVHLVVDQLKAKDWGQPILAQIIGIVLLGDGFRVPHSVVPITGNPAAPRWGRGVATAFGVNPSGDVPKPIRGNTYDVCTKHDIVCDWRSKWTLRHVKKATAVHGSYTVRRYNPRSALWKVAKGIANKLGS